MQSERLSCTVRLPSLVLTAQVVFLLQRGHSQTDKVTDATGHPTHASATAGVGVIMQIKTNNRTEWHKG